MNRFITTLTHILGYAVILLLVSGCVSEKVVDCPPDPSTPYLSLRLSIEDMTPLRKTEAGEDPRNENKIESLQVLFYRSGSLHWAVSPEAATDGNYTFPIPQDKQAGFDGATTYNIYVVTNMTLTAPEQESQLSEQLVTESVAQQPNAKFVMQGKISKQINLSTAEGKQLGQVDLRRVASKLRITPDIQIEGYTQQGNVRVKLINAIDRGYLIKASKPGDAAVITYDYREVESNGAQVFYSYYSDWSSNEALAPYYLVSVPLQKTGETTAQEYSYKVFLTPQQSQLTANKLYDLKVHISKIGSSIPEDPVAISGKLSILEWDNKSGEYDLPASNFLEVSEREAHMYNMNSYAISYQSSKEPVTFSIKEVSYSYVNGATGQSVTDAIQPSSDQYPQVTVDAASKKIKITSALPVNNLPKKIRFTVSNGISTLDKEVTVYQYPSSFITNTWGTKSSRRPKGHLESHLNNKAIYRITVMNPPEGMILGFPPTEVTNFYNRSWAWTHYNYNIAHTDQTTKRDAETARMVSPSFELASQLGATQQYPYYEVFRGTSYINNKKETALCNCATYTETRMVNGHEVILDDWRLPTEAEIKLIDELQRDSKSAVKAIMTGHFYWDANNDNGATELKGGSEGSSSSAYTRCVRDVKENTIKMQVPYR